MVINILYPASIDNNTSLPDVVDNVTSINAEVLNRLKRAILTIENELGVKPSSIYGTVRNRLNIIENALDNAFAGDSIAFGGDLSGSAISQTVVGIQNVPVLTTAPIDGQVLGFNGSSWGPATPSDNSTTLDWILLSSDSFVTIYTLTPAIALNEVVDIAASINIAQSNGMDGYSAVWSRRLFGIQNIGGTLSDPVGNTSDTNNISPILGSFMTGALAQIAIVGTDIVVQAQRPTGLFCYASATVDFVRGVVPSPASAVYSCSPNNLPYIVVSPTLLTITLNSGGTGATAIIVDNYNLTSVTVINNTTVTGVLPAGTYSIGTGNVSVTSPSNPITLVNGFTFVSVEMPTITGFQAGTPDFGSAAGQSSPTISPVLLGTQFISLTSVQLNGVEHISHVSYTSTAITFNSIVSGAVGAFTTVSVTNAAGTVTYGNGTSTGWTYLPAGYHLYMPDFVNLSGSAITQFNDVGDQTADNLAVAITGCNLLSSGIGGQPTAVVTATDTSYTGTATISGWTAGHSFLAGSGNGNITSSSGNGIYNMGSDNVGTQLLLYGVLESSHFGSSGLVAQLDPVSPITLATINAGYIFEESLDSSGNYTMVNTGVPQTTATSIPISFHTNTNLFGGVLGAFVGVEFAAWVLYPNTTLSTPNRNVVTAFLSGKYSIALL
jgi:hypothetical protein